MCVVRDASKPLKRRLLPAQLPTAAASGWVVCQPAHRTSGGQRAGERMRTKHPWTDLGNANALGF